MELCKPIHYCSRIFWIYVLILLLPYVMHCKKTAGSTSGCATKPRLTGRKLKIVLAVSNSACLRRLTVFNLPLQRQQKRRRFRRNYTETPTLSTLDFGFAVPQLCATFSSPATLHLLAPTYTAVTILQSLSRIVSSPLAFFSHEFLSRLFLEL